MVMMTVMMILLLTTVVLMISHVLLQSLSCTLTLGTQSYLGWWWRAAKSPCSMFCRKHGDG
jgi:hypothetical protein